MIDWDIVGLFLFLGNSLNVVLEVRKAVCLSRSNEGGKVRSQRTSLQDDEYELVRLV